MSNKADESKFWPECLEFYELMQIYRHTPVGKQNEVVEAYENVKRWIRDNMPRGDN